MFRFTKKPSSGSHSQCLAKITMKTIISLVLTDSNWVPQEVLPSQLACSVVFFSILPAGELLTNNNEQ